MIGNNYVDIEMRSVAQNLINSVVYLFSGIFIVNLIYIVKDSNGVGHFLHGLLIQLEFIDVDSNGIENIQDRIFFELAKKIDRSH